MTARMLRQEALESNYIVSSGVEVNLVHEHVVEVLAEDHLLTGLAPKVELDNFIADVIDLNVHKCVATRHI